MGQHRKRALMAPSEVLGYVLGRADTAGKPTSTLWLHLLLVDFKKMTDVGGHRLSD